MKKVLLYTAVAFASCVFLSSCDEDNDISYIVQNTSVDDLVEMSFSADFASEQISKAYLSCSEEGTRSFFQQGDAVSVFSGSNNCFFSSDENGVFSGRAPLPVSSTYYALFPYQESATISGNVISAEIPTEVSLNGDFWPDGALAVALSDDDAMSFSFRNVCAVLGFRFFKQAYSKIVITASKNIAGAVSVKVTDGVPVVSGGDSKSIVVNNPYLNTYVGLLPVDGVDITVQCFHENGEVFTYPFSNLSLKRSGFYDMGYVGKEEYPTFTFDANGGMFPDGSTSFSFTATAINSSYTIAYPDNNWNVEEPCFVFWDNNQEIHKPLPSYNPDEYDWVGFKQADVFFPLDFIWGFDRDRTFYAVYSKKHLLRYHADNGVVLSTATYNEHESFSLKNDYYVEGKALKGWKDQDDNFYRIDFLVDPQYMSDFKDLDMYPVWSGTNDASHDPWTGEYIQLF